MHSDLVEIGWTEDHWNRITSVVTEEAQKARVAAQMLPVVGPEDASTVAVPSYTLGLQGNPAAPPPARLAVDSDPTLHLTTLAINVAVRSHQMAEPGLTAALGMFRRAANYIARLEDILIFGGRPAPGVLVPAGPGVLPPVFNVTGDGSVDGLFLAFSGLGPLRGFTQISAMPPPPPVVAPPFLGERIINAIIDSIQQLDAAGQLGPYACALSHDLFAAICTPTPNLVLPRDRILPFLQGPLVRASTIATGWGVVVALSGSPVQIVVASDIGVRFLQTTQEPRYVFRVSQRVALRIKEHAAIGILFP